MTRYFLLLLLLPILGFTVPEKMEAPPKIIHIYVALCDNKYQGIVPVPAKIGNGQDPDNNLYWGCGFGIRTYFKKSKDWKFLTSIKSSGILRERLLFRNATKNVYLIADAYDGKYIKECTKDFLSASCGKKKESVTFDGKELDIAGNAALVAYIGHDGLMDFDLTEAYINTDGKKRGTIILACYSKRFFTQHLRSANVDPLVWTTNLMCPEAYTVHDAISSYLEGGTSADVRNAAAASYSKFQKCSLKAAKGLLVTGW